MRPTLLRVLTDLYVQKLAHTPDEERHYTELALRLLDAVDVPTRAAVAGRLSRHLSPPLRVIERLAADLPDVAAPLRAHRLLQPAAAAPAQAVPAHTAPAIVPNSQALLPEAVVTQTTVSEVLVSEVLVSNEWETSASPPAEQHSAETETATETATQTRGLIDTDIAAELNELFLPHAQTSGG